jgi:hypothetical protein
MRPLRYSINATLDGCCDHRAMFTDEHLHRHAAENLDQADALLFGRVTITDGPRPTIRPLVLERYFAASGTRTRSG